MLLYRSASLSGPGNDLVLAIRGTDDQLTIQGVYGLFQADSALIRDIRFADGTVWTRDQILQKAALGSDLSQTLTCGADGDSLAGLGGPAALRGT